MIGRGFNFCVNQPTLQLFIKKPPPKKRWFFRFQKVLTTYTPQSVQSYHQSPR
jgi:hypothetical protein